ncbi:MAG TPA: amidohydrolase family protein [Xanthobacteraceae bacterium]|nr:amidohydrolase family protein [Xanthobacteraceae bacterium]
MTIDMHSHWFPEKLADAFRQRKTKPMIHTKDGVEYMESMFSAPLRLENLDKRIAEMDRTGVDRGVISLTTVFGVEGLPPDEAIPLCRTNNDGLAEVCAKHPDRFSFLASLPVGDIDAAIAEFERAMTLPGCVGGLLPGDGFLSLKRAERFRPLLETIDRYSAMVLVHYGKTANDTDPIKVDASDNGHPRMGTLDMQARLSQNMITFCLTDYMKSFPNLTLLSHNLGGNIPFEIERMDHRTMIDLPPGSELPSKKFRVAPVLVDCNSLGARAIELAAEVYGADKIVFGSDGTAFGMEWTQKAINESRLDESEREAIRHTNAARAIAKVKRPVQVAAE